MKLSFIPEEYDFLSYRDYGNIKSSSCEILLDFNNHPLEITVNYSPEDHKYNYCVELRVDDGGSVVRAVTEKDYPITVEDAPMVYGLNKLVEENNAEGYSCKMSSDYSGERFEMIDGVEVDKKGFVEKVLRRLKDIKNPKNSRTNNNGVSRKNISQ